MDLSSYNFEEGMKMKKSLVILGICLCCLLMGCAKKEAASGSGSGENRPVTITVGGWPSGDEAFKAALAGFNEKYPNIRVEFEFSSDAGTFFTLLQSVLAAGDGAPDVVMIEGANIANFRDSPVLENFLSAPYNAEQYEKDFSAYKWRLGYSADGKQLVAIPWDMGPCTLFYRSDVFESAGLSSDPADVAKMLSTWEGVLDVAKKIYIPGKRWFLPNASYLYYQLFINRDYFDENLNLHIERPGDLECLNAVIEMRKNNWDMNTDMWSTEAYAAYANGSLGGVISGAWFGGFLKTGIDPNGSGHWRITSLMGGAKAVNWGGSFLAIPKQSKHKEEAWAFITYMLATARAQNEMFQAVDYFPAYKPAWDDTAIYEAPDPYFGGQKTKALWKEIAGKLEPVYSTMMDSTGEGQILSSVNAGLERRLDAAGIRDLFKTDFEAAIAELKRQQIQVLEDAGVWKK
jgi:multiple sugar transport system substrate-binding protein